MSRRQVAVLNTKGLTMTVRYIRTARKCSDKRLAGSLSKKIYEIKILSSFNIGAPGTAEHVSELFMLESDALYSKNPHYGEKYIFSM